MKKDQSRCHDKDTTHGYKQTCQFTWPTPTLQTSCTLGVGPSPPPGTRLSNKDWANARAAAHASIEPQRNRAMMMSLARCWWHQLGVSACVARRRRHSRGCTQFPRTVDLANTCTPGAGPPPFPTGQWQASLTLACLSHRKRRSSRKSSGCCSSDVFGNLCPCLRSPAGVAVLSTLVATTVQRVRWQGCWAAEDFRWRAQQLASAGGRGRVTTNVRVQDMDFLPLRHLDNRRLEVVVDGLPLFRGRSWLSTPPWCLQSGVTGQPGASVPPPAEQPWTKLGGAKSALTPSWLSHTVEFGLWSLVVKWGDAGPRSLANSWQDSRRPKPGQSWRS